MLPNCCRLLLLLMAACSMARGQVSYTVVVDNNDTFNYLQSAASLLRTNYNATSANIQFNFTLLDVNATMKQEQHAVRIYQLLVSMQADAVISDYYISMAVATISKNIPYFISSRVDFSSIEYKENMFKYEIDYSQMNASLYDVSTALNRRGFGVLSDDSATSQYFLSSLTGKTFTKSSVTHNTTDSEIYQLLIRSTSFLKLRSWVLMFDPANLYLIERIFNQSGPAGLLRNSDIYIIPSLVEKQQYLQNVRQSEAVIYTFLLQNMQRYSDLELQRVFLRDCLNHFALSINNMMVVNNRNFTIIHALANTTMVGESGFFAYQRGRRHQVTLSVIGMDRSLGPGNFFNKVGQWTQGAAVPYTLDYTKQVGIKNSVFRFAAIEEAPYIYRNIYGQLTGISIELINMMQAKLQFQYEILLVPDGAYGTLVNGSWTGIMKYLVENKAELSANFLSATAERLGAVETSINLRQSGIQMLFKRRIHNLNFFHVFFPFSWYVWLSILFSMFVLSATLWLSDKLSPNEEEKSMFSLMESFFLVFSSFLMSKVETEPRKPSARLFTLLLWFSTLFYMTTYVSNLVAFLVKPDDTLPFKTITELEHETSYKYVLVGTSASYNTAQRRWPELVRRAQENWPVEFMQPNIAEAVRTVQNNENYVFIGSASSIQYETTKDCQLKSYGAVEEVVYETLLMSKSFKYKEEVRSFLNSVRYTEFSKLEQKYFSVNRCPSSVVDSEDRKSLGFNYFAGLFALVGVGAVLGFLYIFLHWVIKKIYTWVSRRHGKKLRYGENYDAEIVKIIKEGVWIGIAGRRQFYFIANNSLHADPTKVKNAKLLGLHLGDTIQVQYFGKDEATQNRIFARLYEDNPWYQEQLNRKDDSDSD